MREIGLTTGGPAALTRADRSRFLSALDAAVAGRPAGQAAMNISSSLASHSRMPPVMPASFDDDAHILAADPLSDLPRIAAADIQDVEVRQRGMKPIACAAPAGSSACAPPHAAPRCRYTCRRSCARAPDAATARDAGAGSAVLEQREAHAGAQRDHALHAPVRRSRRGPAPSRRLPTAPARPAVRPVSRQAGNSCHAWCRGWVRSARGRRAPRRESRSRSGSNRPSGPTEAVQRLDDQIGGRRVRCIDPVGPG